VDNKAEACWPYVGRTKFKKLVKNLEKVRKSRQYTTVWLYGTQGYGKSHLLAALVCYLAAQDERVVYIPDCRALLKDSVGYVRAALLFAWADDIPTQMEIMTLNTQEDIREFLESQKNVIFVIDQMNALKNPSNNPIEATKRSDLYYWIMSLTTDHKSVLSTSANYREFHEQNQQQTSNLVVYAYGGFNRVSHRKIMS
jgi:predicted ATPase